MEAALQNVLRDVASCQSAEAMLRGKPRTALKRPGRGRGRGRGRPLQVPERDPSAAVRRTVRACRLVRGDREESAALSDQALSDVAEFVDGVDLSSYRAFLHYVPRIVNVVRLRACAARGGAR